LLLEKVGDFAKLFGQRGGVMVRTLPDKVRNEHLSNLRGVKQIWKLDLAGSQHVTDAGLATLKHLPALRVLIMNGMKQLSDDGLKELRECRSLEVVEFAACPKVTNAGLMQLDGLPQLRNVRLDDSGVTAEGIKLFQFNNPKVMVK